MASGAARGRRGLRLARGKARWLLALLALGGVAVVGPWGGTVTGRLGSGYDTARWYVLPRLEPLVIPAARASSHVEGHPPRHAIDADLNTFWAEGSGRGGSGEWLEVGFAEPLDIGQVAFTLGNENAPERFVRQPVPREVTLVFRGADGDTVTTKELTLEQVPQRQDFGVRARGVKTVRIEIGAVHRAQGGTAAAIAEVAVWVRR